MENEAGERWLRKLPRAGRVTEPAIEALTLELARRCGLDVAEGVVTTWSTEQGPLRGFASRSFQADGEEQHTGAVLLTADWPDIDPESIELRTRASLAAVRMKLQQRQNQTGADLLRPFVRMLIFDAWIGNGDRHSRNWALLLSRDSCRLAPMFDTAACLGSELLDGHRLLANPLPDAVRTYSNRCRSGFGDGASEPGVLMKDVLTEIRAWPETKVATEELLPKVLELLTNEVDDLIEEIPETWMSLARKRFARAALRVRATIVEGALT